MAVTEMNFNMTTPVCYLTLYAVATLDRERHKGIKYDTCVSLNTSMDIVRNSMLCVLEQTYPTAENITIVDRDTFENFKATHSKSDLRVIDNSARCISPDLDDLGGKHNA